MDEEKLVALLQESLNVATRTKAAKPSDFSKVIAPAAAVGEPLQRQGHNEFGLLKPDGVRLGEGKLHDRRLVFRLNRARGPQARHRNARQFVVRDRHGRLAIPFRETVKKQNLHITTGNCTANARPLDNFPAAKKRNQHGRSAAAPKNPKSVFAAFCCHGNGLAPWGGRQISQVSITSGFLSCSKIGPLFSPKRPKNPLQTPKNPIRKTSAPLKKAGAREEKKGRFFAG
jgi:hypothetical protein